MKISKEYETIPVCPEILGGLPIPRPACEIIGGDGAMVLDGLARVIQMDGGKNITSFLIDGARKVQAKIEGMKIKFAILKERSPSCGVKYIYNGGKLVEGMGVTTAALSRQGMKVFSENDFPEGRKSHENQ